jgi:hypothetical protein
MYYVISQFPILFLAVTFQLSHVSVSSLSSDRSENKRLNLLWIQETINNDRSIHPSKAGDQVTSAQAIYKKKFWEPYIQNLPILVLVMDWHTNRLGNFLGTYFDSIACAEVTGMHYVGVRKKLVGHEDNHEEKFWQALPELIVHNNPVTPEEALKLIDQRCSCDRYCWTADDPWRFILPNISRIMEHGLQLHLSMTAKHQDVMIRDSGFHLNPKIDLTNSLPGTVLPLIPDVAIHYRCSDNLYGGMGLIAFGQLIRLIPTESKYIYVFTEYARRLENTPLESAAPTILKALHSDLRSHFPSATVVIKKGGNEFTIWAQFAFANVTICSPSTYCLWPAMARKGATYMPATAYISAKRGSQTGHFDMGPNWHWIPPMLYNNFTKTTPVADILNTIRMDL